MDEQFIQDAICQPERLSKLLHELKYPWQFHSEGDDYADVINQEFNFSAIDEEGVRQGGRLDVIGTFENRKKLVLIEVKVAAGNAEIEQLNWYMNHASELKNADSTLSGVNETIGILLSGDFLPLDRSRLLNGCHLVQFSLQSSDGPFIIDPETVDLLRDESIATRFKHSQLVSAKSWRDIINQDKPWLLDAFDRIYAGFLGELNAGGKYKHWFVQNPKAGHIALHYKGRYYMWVFPQKNAIKFGYETATRGNRHVVIKDEEDLIELDRVRQDIEQLFEMIDELQQEFIPDDFDW